MAANRRSLGCLGGLSLVVGPIVVLAGLAGRAFQTEYSNTVEPNMSTPNTTIAIGVILIILGIALLVWRFKVTSTDSTDPPDRP